jgi:hypothetical protein
MNDGEDAYDTAEFRQMKYQIKFGCEYDSVGFLAHREEAFED